MINLQQEISIEGTLSSDGTLQLDEKPNLQPGRITVVLRRGAEPRSPNDDSFWQRMQAMWAIPIFASDGGDATSAEVRKLRAEWDERQEKLERLSDECRTAPSEDSQR